MKMPTNYVSTVNPIDSNTTAPAPSIPIPEGGTIKYHVDKTGELLRDTTVLLDRLIEFIWTENNVTFPCTVDVRDLDSATVNNYIMAQGINDRVQVICDRIGLDM